MDKKEFKSERFRNIHFKIDELYCFSLHMSVHDSFGSKIRLDFDEIMHDGIPYMVHMYSMLKERKPYDFPFDDGEGIVETSNFFTHDDEDYVHFSVRVKRGNGYSLQCGAEIMQDVLVDYLQMEFELLFHTLLHHPDFPHQYPACDYVDTAHYDAIDEKFNKKYKHSKLSSWKLHKLEKKFYRKRVKKYKKEGIIFLRKYLNMLETYEVPIEWLGKSVPR